ncbi:hypothetical protein CTB91_01358 [Dickeya solani]|uniref:Uncharacterized protein n=1 Tax=Dickeya solani D s0432-1 TaxID=1231725 RepID=A0AAV3KCJ0_9GAMM|nr:hypothetical protein A4U42_15775 [Dickeya solani IPO 2222]AUH07921.1 hypothetical protein BJD21_05265 [Dickeya solani D s0432-1]AUH11943.1 hypothetical protein BJJ98_05230 [Dickeya solani]AYQ47174.1 hypothetical protein CTB91_01358 [Dickeya solani]AYQ51346.1 hypothetical protein DSOL99_01364 [Dickeya solani]
MPVLMHSRKRMLGNPATQKDKVFLSLTSRLLLPWSIKREREIKIITPALLSIDLVKIINTGLSQVCLGLI